MVSYPNDWDVVALGTKCDITSSKRVFESEWTKHGIPFLRTRDIASFHAGEEQKDKLFISEETYRDKTAVSGEPHKGDLLVTGVGTIGLPYLVSSNDKMYFKDGNILWVKKSEDFVSEYLYLQFLSKDIIEQIHGGSGFTTVGTFTIKNAKKLMMPMPSTKEQEAIAETLEVFDAHIANLAEFIEKKKAIRDGALEDLVSGRTRLDGFRKEWTSTSFAQFTTQMVDGPFGSDLKTEHYTLNHEARVIQLSNIGENGWNDANIKYTTFAHAAELSRCITKPGELLIAKMMPAGRAILCPSGEDMYIISSDVVRVIVNDNVDSRFVVYGTKGECYLNQITENTQGSTRQRTSIRKLKKIKLMLPEYEEQKAIADVLTAMDDEIKDLEDERDKIIQIREGAMDDLLTGRVRLTI